jgi:hypothetical protein
MPPTKYALCLQRYWASVPLLSEGINGRSSSPTMTVSTGFPLGLRSGLLGRSSISLAPLALAFCSDYW